MLISIEEIIQRSLLSFVIFIEVEHVGEIPVFGDYFDGVIVVDVLFLGDDVLGFR